MAPVDFALIISGFFVCGFVILLLCEKISSLKFKVMALNAELNGYYDGSIQQVIYKSKEQRNG